MFPTMDVSNGPVCARATYRGAEYRSRRIAAISLSDGAPRARAGGAVDGGTIDRRRNRSKILTRLSCAQQQEIADAAAPADRERAEHP